MYLPEAAEREQSRKPATIQKARQLCPVDATHKTKKSVRELAEDALAPVNGHKRPPETIITMGDFVTDIYLPFVTAQKRPSTYKGYRDMWEDHLKPRSEKVLLRDVRTCYVQRWLEAVAAEDRTKTDAKLQPGISEAHQESLERDLRPCQAAGVL